MISYYYSSPTITNTIIWGNIPQEIKRLESGIITISYSDIQGGKASIVGDVNWLDGNINADPMFVDAANSDYHLTAGSPCIEAGCPALNVPDKDIDGNPRPKPPGSKPDMGAYEYPSTSASKTSIIIISDRTVNKGTIFSASVNIKDAINLAGFQVDIVFDPRILEASSAEEGNFLSSTGATYWRKPDIDNIKGTITGIVCAKSSKGGANGNGILVNVTFKAIGAGKSQIKLQNVSLSDTDGELTPAELLDGSVIVIQCPWDVNKDGQVNVIDFVIVGQHFGEKITPPVPDPNPDVNGDGTVDILDFVLVGQHFGESCLPAAPLLGIWTFDPQYLPVLIKMYNIMKDNPSSDFKFVSTKEILYRLIFHGKPAKTEVFQNFPNPFNPETWIPYQLADDSEVSIRIYSVSGQPVKSIDLGYKKAGLYVTKDLAVYWDGTNDFGERISSGIYFYSIKAGDYRATKKMIIDQ